MLGAVIGDIVGSVYEFQNDRRKNFGPLFHPKAFFTDDSICTLAVADALVNERHAGEALKDWGLRYWEVGGWGGMFSRWLQSPGLEPYNSYGNGAAMARQCECHPLDYWPARWMRSLSCRNR